jgi:nucleotide-binding universal stress UspA family protein
MNAEAKPEEEPAGEMMKILIAYDGSGGSDEMLNDLRRAGLPGKAEAMVISISESWFLLSGGFLGAETNFVTEALGSVKEALALARQAAERIQSDFPDWNVRHSSVVGSPAAVLIEKADEWKPDLLALGAHGHTAAGRFLLGSVSQTVMTHAHCSVRVARAGKKDSAAPIRLIIGVDGSPGAEAAVRAAAARHWPKGAEARVVSAFQTPAIAPDRLRRHENVAAQMAALISGAKFRANEISASAANRLRGAGLIVSSVVKEENPKRLLIREAEDWGADCIFVGARGLSRIERFWLGSVSTAVAMRAHCSVEVVREKQ